MMPLKLFQIFYKEEQGGNLIDGFIPHKNEKKSIFVETQCMYDIRNKTQIDDAKYIGVFSYSFHNKVIHKPSFKDIITSIESSRVPPDILSPKPYSWWWPPLRQPRPLYFPNQLNIADDAIPFLEDLSDLGLIDQSSIRFWKESYNKSIYCNFWIAKKEIFVDYVDNFLRKVFDLVNSYDRKNKIFTIDRSYPSPPPQDWVDSTGFKSYPMITFIIERLINLYIQDKGLDHQNVL